MKMIPHDTVQGTCRAAEPRQPVPGPRHRIEDALGTQPVKLLLVAVRKGIPQLDQILVVSPVSAPGRRWSPAGAERCDTAVDAADPDPPEVLFKAAQVRVAAIDHASQGGRSNQHCLRVRADPGHANHRFGRQVVKITGKRLELRDNTQDIGMRNRPPELQGASRTVNFTQLSVRLS